MGLFGDDKKDELERITSAFTKADASRKRLAAELAADRTKTAGMQAKIDEGQVEIERLKGKLLKVKLRQKASVERANRFKAQLTRAPGSSTDPMTAVL